MRKIEPIDKLQIQIEADSTRASKGIEALTSSLQALRGAVRGGIGLTTATRQLTRFAEAVDKMKAPTHKIQTLVEALKPLETIGRSNLGSTLNQLKKIPDITAALDSGKLKDFADKIQEVTIAVAPLANEMEKVSRGFSKLPANIQRAINANARLTKSNTKTTFSFNMIAAKIGIIVLAARKVGKVLSGWINESTDYVENLNLFTITMGDNMEKAKKYAEEVGAAVGIDPSEFMRYQAIFQNMTTGFGIAADKASIMSKNLTTLGYDLASVFNVKFETAMQKLESALAGQPRPMREWGFDLSEATLKAVALEKGISKNVETMGQMEKAQLRYIQLIETAQKLNLTGNFARELITTANQIRVFQAQVVQAARALGNIFIPAINAILPYLTAALIVLRKIAIEIGSLVGFEMPEIDYSGLNALSGVGEGLGDAFDDATDSAKELKRAVLGFDELNILNFGKAAAGADGSDLLNLDLPEYDFLKDLTENRTQQLAEKIEKPLRRILKLVTVIGAGMLAWKIGTGILNSLALLKSSLQILGGTGAGSIASVAKGFVGAAGLAGSMYLAYVGGKQLADSLYGGASSLSSSLLNLVGGVAGGAVSGALIGGPIGAVIGGLAGVVAGIYSLIKTQDEYIKQNILDKIFNENGVEVEKFANILAEMYKPYSEYTNKQVALNDELQIAKTRLNDAEIEVAGLLSTLEHRDDLDSTDIERMRTAFNNLFEAVKKVSTLSFDAIFGGLYQAINLNLGAAAQSQIAGMITELQRLKRELDLSVSESQRQVEGVFEELETTGQMTPAMEATLMKAYKDIAAAELLKPNEDAATLAALLGQLKREGIKGSPEDIAVKLNEILSQYEKISLGFDITAEMQKQSLDKTMKWAEQRGIDTSLIDEEKIKEVLEETSKTMLDEVTDSYKEVFKEIAEALYLEKSEVTSEFYNSIGFFSEAFSSLKGLFKGLTHEESKEKYAADKTNEMYKAVNEILRALANALGVNSGLGVPMASGGVATKPTLAYVGEYAGASTNPEIITPESTMYDVVVEANTPMVSAIVKAIQSLEKTVRSKDTTLELDGDAISRSVISNINDYAQRTGRSPIYSN